MKAIHVETIIGMTMGGHQNFPYVYGLTNKTIIVTQFFGKFVSNKWVISSNLGKAVFSFVFILGR